MNACFHLPSSCSDSVVTHRSPRMRATRSITYCERQTAACAGERCERSPTGLGNCTHLLRHKLLPSAARLRIFLLAVVLMGPSGDQSVRLGSMSASHPLTLLPNRVACSGQTPVQGCDARLRKCLPTPHLSLPISSYAEGPANTEQG